MRRSDIQPMPEIFGYYIEKADDVELITGLEKSALLFDDLIELLEPVRDYRYAPGKWTVRDIIQHITDNELIQLTRAVRISRGDATVQPGYDENVIASGIDTSTASVTELVAGFKQLRSYAINVYKRCTDEMLVRRGVCFNVELSALALGFHVIGHQVHHLGVIRDKYLIAD